jgi:hypothetical protein
MLLWHGEEVDEQRAVTLSLALCDREVARASARASAELCRVIYRVSHISLPRLSQTHHTHFHNTSV